MCLTGRAWATGPAHKKINDMNEIKVGDILAGTWGYSMIIPEFFEVTGKTAKTLKVRRLEKEMLRPNACGQQGYEVPAEPLRDDVSPFSGTARMSVHGGLFVKMEYAHVKKWDGRKIWADYMD